MHSSILENIQVKIDAKIAYKHHNHTPVSKTAKPPYCQIISFPSQAKPDPMRRFLVFQVWAQNILFTDPDSTT